MANSVDPDQTAPEGAVWSRSTLFAYVILSDALLFEFLGYLLYNDYKADRYYSFYFSGLAFIVMILFWFLFSWIYHTGI